MSDTAVVGSMLYQVINVINLMNSTLPNNPYFRSMEYKQQECKEMTEIMEILLNNNSYNRNRIPNTGGNRAVNVSVELWVQSVSEVSDTTRDFKTVVYMSEMWWDPGLAYSHLGACKRNMTLHAAYLKRIWIPNLTFINSKTAKIHESPFVNLWLMLYENGSVWVNYRMNLTGPCSTNLITFPMDRRECWLTFESFNYNVEEVRMRWHGNRPVALIKDVRDDWMEKKGTTAELKGTNMNAERLQMADFDLTNIRNTSAVALYPAGFWDELTVRFEFKRRYGWYIFNAYLPTYLTIFISWISFCLGTRAIPARTMLCVNALLALTFQFGTIISNLPRVSYVKAIDVWMLSCITFVFATLIELAVVGYFTRHEDSPLRRKHTTMTPATPRLSTASESFSHYALLHAAISGYSGDNLAAHTEEKTTELVINTAGSRRASEVRKPGYSAGYNQLHTHYQSFPDRNARVRKYTNDDAADSPTEIKSAYIDYVSSILFPSSFAFFNLIYWSYYSYMSADPDD